MKLAAARARRLCEGFIVTNALRDNCSKYVSVSKHFANGVLSVYAPGLDNGFTRPAT